MKARLENQGRINVSLTTLDKKPRHKLGTRAVLQNSTPIIYLGFGKAEGQK